jgi:hypothetical protein
MKAFYLCDDPIGIKPEGMVAFVYTPDKPRFFASLIKLDPAEPMPEMDYSSCSILFKHMDGDDKLHYYILATVQNIDKAANSQLTAALKEGAEWYAICLLNIEYKATGKRGGWRLLTEYNEQLKDVQLLQFKATDTYLLSYHNGVRNFPDLSSARVYMRDTLGYPPDAVKVGMLNQD